MSTNDHSTIGQGTQVFVVHCGTVLPGRFERKRASGRYVVRLASGQAHEANQCDMFAQESAAWRAVAADNQNEIDILQVEVAKALARAQAATRQEQGLD